MRTRSRDDWQAAVSTFLMLLTPLIALVSLPAGGLLLLGVFMVCEGHCEGIERWQPLLMLVLALTLPVLAIVSWRERKKGRWQVAGAVLLALAGWFYIVTYAME